MREAPPLGTTGWIGLIVVILLAASARVGYLATCCEWGASPPRLVVQGDGPRLDFAAQTQLRNQDAPTEFDNLVHNRREHHWFGGLAPLADKEEQTAHAAPGYYWLASYFASDADLRRLQAGLGLLTVICLFFFARDAFASNAVALIVGVLAALHPFWIVNLAELADGTVITFLLAAALFLGTSASRTGGPLSSVLFGLSIAGLALVRAVYLPFSFLALGWFLLRCRHLRLGWFVGLLALLGFGNGLAPWLFRNHSAFQDIVPVASSTYLHAWMGNYSGATGGPVDEKALRASLEAERVKELVAEKNQAKRYNRLSHDVVRQVRSDPAGALARRFGAGVRFLFGEAWLQKQTLVESREGGLEPPTIVAEWAPFAHHAALFLLFSLGTIGWRLSKSWSKEGRLATLAFLWAPIPYVLSHAEALSGPRLPWDATLIVFAGYAVAWLLPSVRSHEIDVPILKQAIQEASTRRL
jgi:hypothetical protein